MYDLWGEEEQSDTAQVCLNGHPINSTACSNPHMNRKFCDKCGQPTILECPNCRAAIRGYSGYETPGIPSKFEYEPPAFCYECGSAFPWTEARVKAAKDLTAEWEELTEEERRTLAASVDDIVRDSPQAGVAATRLKKILAKVGKHGGATLLDIIKGVASEAAKKILWPVP